MQTVKLYRKSVTENFFSIYTPPVVIIRGFFLFVILQIIKHKIITTILDHINIKSQIYCHMLRISILFKEGLELFQLMCFTLFNVNTCN